MKCSQISNSLWRSPPYAAVLLTLCFLCGFASTQANAQIADPANARSLASLTPAQRAQVAAAEKKIRQEMKAVQQQGIAMCRPDFLRKPMSKKKLAALEKRFRTLSVQGFLLQNRLVAMSQGHLLLSDHPKVKQPGPSIHDLARQGAEVGWQTFLWGRQLAISPPKTAKEKAVFATHMHSLQVKGLLVASALKAVQDARYLPHGEKQKRNMLATATKMLQNVAAIPAQINQAAYSNELNFAANLSLGLSAMSANQGHARLKGEVVDPQGHVLNGVKMVVGKTIFAGMHGDELLQHTKIINGKFDISESGFKNFSLTFSKVPWRTVEIEVDAKGAFGVPSEYGVGSTTMPFTRKGNTWTVRVVLPTPLPQVSLDNYNGTISEGPKGLGDAITLSKSSLHSSRYRLSNVNLTKPDRLPPYTFYVTFKRDAKGRALMKSIENKSNNGPVTVPEEMVFHLTGKGVGFVPVWPPADQNPMKWAPAGGYRRTLVYTAAKLKAKGNLVGCMFYIKIGKKYGRGSFSESDIHTIDKGRGLKIADFSFRVQEKDYGSRYIYPY